MCVEVVMLTNVDTKILFHFASAEGNSACQRRILGREEREPGSAQAAAEQRPGGRGLQGQCTMARSVHACREHAVAPAGMRAPPKRVSLPVLAPLSWVCLLCPFRKVQGTVVNLTVC